MRAGLTVRTLKTHDHIARCAIFDEYAELDFPELNDSMVRHLRRVGREAVAEKTGRPYSVEVWREKPDGAIKTWLETPEEWSPFIDEVAIGRALDFEESVIENLSRLEVAEFIGRLSEHPDPWEAESVNLGHGGYGGGMIEETDPDVLGKSMRRQAWEALPRELREEILWAVQRRRQYKRSVNA